MLQAGPAAAVPPPAFDAFPYRAKHEPSRASALVLLALLAALACIVLVPVALALAYAPQDIAGAAARKPLAVGMLATGLVVWLALLWGAGYRVVRTLWCRYSVSVTPARVVLTSSGLFGAKLHIQPLAEFRGVAHRVRATLAGVRHELLLVQSGRGQPVLLHAAGTISQTTIDRAAALLRLPQIPAGELYHRPGQAQARSAPIVAMPQATQAA